jgi:hypothetical protein
MYQNLVNVVLDVKHPIYMLQTNGLIAIFQVFFKNVKHNGHNLKKLNSASKLEVPCLHNLLPLFFAFWLNPNGSLYS